MFHVLMIVALAFSAGAADQQRPPSPGRGMQAPAAPRPSSVEPPPPVCDEGRVAAKAVPLSVPPPVFIRRAGLPRLLFFVHGLQGDGVTSWQSGSQVYWPSLVAQDPQFADFDVFVYEYVVNTNAPVRLGEAAEHLLATAYKQDLISRYRDAVFVTEGDGVFLVRELLRRVPPIAKRVAMIFVAGRIQEASRPLVTDRLALRENFLVDQARDVGWRDFRENDRVSWSMMETAPWIHCAVLGSGPQRTAERDDGSSFCSTMPLVIQGKEWRSLRPSCFQDPIHEALRRSMKQYSAPETQLTAAKPTEETVTGSAIRVPCQQTAESFVELPIPFDAIKEELLSVEAYISDSALLKATKVAIDRVVGRIAYVKYWLVAYDPPPAGAQTTARSCPDGSATIGLRVLKRPK